MSMRTRISTLDKRTKNKIIAMLYANGCYGEDVTMLLKNGTLADVSDYIDLEDLF